MIRFRLLGCGLYLFSSSAMAENSLWRYWASIDISYANAFQSSDEMLLRSKATSTRLNSSAPNMGMFYLHKLVDENSCWGFELGGQAGYDNDGQVPAEQILPGYSMLRYI